MATPVMTAWVVTYRGHNAAGGLSIATADVKAAYYALEDGLVEFKDSSHQVTFAIDAGIVLTIQRDDEKQAWANA
jgi:hypothetical protein